MPILKNARRELYAQCLASGKTATQAYAEAGYAKDRRNASRLTSNDDIRARVAELQALAADRVVLTKEFVNTGTHPTPLGAFEEVFERPDTRSI